MLYWDYHRVYSEEIGEHGLPQGKVEHILENIVFPARDRLIQEINSGKWPLFQIDQEKNHSDSSIQAIQQCTEKIRKKAKHIVILGTGGSSLCAQALCGLNRLQRDLKNVVPQLHFTPNPDPDSMFWLLESLPLEETHFLVVSKSGATLETLSQFSVCFDAVANLLDEDAATSFTVITDPGDGPLRTIAKRLNISCLEHEPGIGGRFSIFTNVGLLPAQLAGLNISAILKGASEIINLFLRQADNCDISRAVAMHLVAQQMGYTQTVLMPYIDRLRDATIWVRQIWAESLGKNGKGTTLIDALGTLDQHSQQQLYLDGPRDKWFTIITASHPAHNPITSKKYLNDQRVEHIGGKTLSRVMDVSAQATAETLAKNGMPLRELHIDPLNEYTLGIFCMHFILETVLTGYALEMNPFDQPAVEAGKIRAKELLAAEENQPLT